MDQPLLSDHSRTRLLPLGLLRWQREQLLLVDVQNRAGFVRLGSLQLCLREGARHDEYDVRAADAAVHLVEHAGANALDPATCVDHQREICASPRGDRPTRAGREVLLQQEVDRLQVPQRVALGRPVAEEHASSRNPRGPLSLLRGSLQVRHGGGTQLRLRHLREREHALDGELALAHVQVQQRHLAVAVQQRVEQATAEHALTDVLRAHHERHAPLAGRDCAEGLLSQHSRRSYFRPGFVEMDEAGKGGFGSVL